MLSLALGEALVSGRTRTRVESASLVCVLNWNPAVWGSLACFLAALADQGLQRFRLLRYLVWVRQRRPVSQAGEQAQRG